MYPSAVSKRLELAFPSFESNKKNAESEWAQGGEGGGTSKLREGEEGARERKGPGETEGREEIKRVAWAGYKYPTKKISGGKAEWRARI